MISSNELESARAGGDEASLGNKVFSSENLGCQISVPYLATFLKPTKILKKISQNRIGKF